MTRGRVGTGKTGRIALALFTVLAMGVSSNAPLKATGLISPTSEMNAAHAVGPGDGLGSPRTTGAAHTAQDDFDHAVHADLFPTCSGCHAAAGPRGGEMFPPSASCRACHDGVDLESVDWAGPTPEASLLTFDHEVHAIEVADADESTVCGSCHAEPSEASPTVAPSFEGCTSCHTHDAPDHSGQTSCTTCHTTLSATPALAGASAGFERPADHDTPGFLNGEHGERDLFEQSRCATCHTSDRCASCHVDAQLPEITSLGSWPEASALPPWENTYPVPATHDVAGFATAHWSEGTTANDCSTCHTRDDCATCHTPPLNRWDGLVDLTPRSLAVAAGATLERESPATHRTPGFQVHHEVEAEVSASECATCHTEASCVACHEGVQTPVYHEPGYEAGHAADAASRFLDCSACHDTVVFCRTCHAEAGIMDQSVGAAYHDAEPLWLLRHGQAARQTLEGCVSCHEQRDCTRCHSSVGAFRVSPHGPGFDPGLAQDKNPRACALCHLTDPRGR